MHFVSWPEFAAGTNPQHRANAIAVSDQTNKTDAQSRLRRCVTVELCFAGILRHDKVQPAISIEISRSRTTLFAVDEDAALARREAVEPPLAISPK